MSDIETLSHRRRALRLAAPFFAGALVLGACSKSSDTSTSNTAAPATTAKSSGGGTDTTAAASGTTTKGTTAAGQINLSGTKVWYQGFRYDLGDVAYDKSTGDITIKTKVTNLGSETATPYPPVSLQSNGSQLATGSLTSVDGIVGGKTIDNSFKFSVDPDKNVDLTKTDLVFTSGSTTQEATIPLGNPSSGKNLEPIQQAQTPPPLQWGGVSFTISKVEVRWDIPNDHNVEADAGKAFVVFYGTVKNDGTNTVYLDGSNVTLTTDTGTYTATIVGGISVEPKQSYDKAQLYFQVKEPVDGEWTLELKDQDNGNGEKASTTAKVSLNSKSGGTGGSTGTTQKKTNA